MSNIFEYRKILILGSAGQIGRPLTKYLRLSGYEVEEMDLVYGEFDDLRRNSNEKLNRLLIESDFVFFLAFDVGGSHYLAKNQDSFKFIENNLAIILNTFQALKFYKTPFLYASSQMSNLHFSTYGILKSIAERITKSLGGLVVNFWNIFGPEREESKFHVISDFISMGLKKSEIRMLTDGKEFRDFLYVDDCCEALFKVMKNFNDINKDRNVHIARGQFTQVIDIAKIVGELTNSIVIPGNSKDIIQRGVMSKPDSYIREFWKPKTSILEGIEKVIDQMKLDLKL